MSSLERLEAFVRRIERRLRWMIFTRGAAVLAAAALSATVLVVLLANGFAFSEPSVAAARLALFLAVALAAGFGLVLPLVRLNRAGAARKAESRLPELEQRLITFAEAPREAGGPFLDLLAADTLRVIEEAGPDRLSMKRAALACGSAAVAAGGLLIWLAAAGPGYLGYGAALLWAGPPKAGAAPFYDVVVTPGDATIRRKADQLITARLVGFEASRVRLAARYRGTARWEEALMKPQSGGTGYELLLAGVPDSLEYYVEAGGVRSRTYAISVVDLPAVQRIRVTYRYPQWTGLQPATEDPGGDLRAVQGTEAELAVETDQPLERGFLVLDDGTRIPLHSRAGNWAGGRITLSRDGMYHVAVVDKRPGGSAEQLVRISDDYFIEARQDDGPAVRIVRPGRDTRTSPIEEVTVAVEAEDDFGLQALELRYSANGGPERTVTLLDRKGARQASGEMTLYLEDLKLAPGDVVSLYATARDARNSSNTDIFFLEAQPFEREYSQSQQMGGGQGGGEQDESRIAERQKEIIAATWNQIREKSKDAETAGFLAGVQSKLRDQARSLAKRMQSRELSRANQEFASFSEEMEKAAEAMTTASDKLKAANWQEAIQPEQKALQHLLRAETTFRRIQVAFGSRGGSRGGGRSGAGRDLENLFDLELDTEKNQYETGQRAGAPDRQQRELDEALEKLKELARRQQELARQQQARQSFEQRWQQEILRREAQQLRQRMEQLSRGSGGSQSASESSSSASTSAAGERLRSMARPGVDPRVRQALERLAQAEREMTRPGGQQRAAEQLSRARDLLGGMRQQEAAAQMEDMARRARQLAEQQRDFAERLRRTFGDGGVQPGRTRQEAEQLAEEKDQMVRELERLERDMQRGARELANGQRAAASKLREALGDMQGKELSLRMKYNAELIRRGLGPSAILREAPVTAGLQELRDQLQAAQAALDSGGVRPNELARALAQLERARRQLDSMARQGQRGTSQRSAGGAQAAGEGQRGDVRGQQHGGGQASGSWSARNFGDWQPADPARTGSPQGYAEALRDLAQMRRALQSAPEIAQDLDSLLRDMQRYDPRRTPGNPALLERIHARFLSDLDRIELQIRRQLGETDLQARTGAGERIPPGYADAVAEYFRRLSKER